MSTSTPIPKQLDELALDQRRLFELGLAQIRRLAAHTWTDHNIHDPGITILELAAYALTDLGNRVSIALEDLLASETNNAANMRSQFFTARTILPGRPLTELDYRKLLIDLPGVVNAWVMPAKRELYADTTTGKLKYTSTHAEGEVVVELGGVYDVLLDIESEQPESVIADARRVLDANRNLGQDFEEISIVEPESFQLCCELDIAPKADPAVVMAELRVRVGDHMAPRVPRHGLAELLARTHADGRPYTVDEIFSGPALQHGFIIDEDLVSAEQRTELRLSDIIHVIMDIPGVVAVRDIVLRPVELSQPPSEPSPAWLIPITAGRKPTLDPSKSKILLYKQGMVVGTDEVQVQAHVDELHREAHAIDERDHGEDLPLPLGRPLAVAEYHSFQNHFPVVYGLSDAGLPGTASPARRVQADQLKAYLLFFDQLLADFLAQLGKLRELYSTDPNQQRARFHQVVDSFRDWARIYGFEAIQDGLDELDDSAALERARERFLDHQIARVAEDFSQLRAVLSSAFPDPEQVGPSIFRAKCEFLRDYPALGAERGLSWDRSLTAPGDLWNSENVAGFERRLARLLGIRNIQRRNLADISNEFYPEIDPTPTDEYRFRICNEEGKILLSSTSNYPTIALAQRELRVAIELAKSPAGYQRKLAEDGRHHFVIVTKSGEIVARRNRLFDRVEDMEAAIAETIAYLVERYDDEGMFVIEGILLRPRASSDPMLPICADPNCADCSDMDPYSHRLHVILPAYGVRFANIEFRRFVERTIRVECPAHLLPRICWLSMSDMASVQTAYRKWLLATADQRASTLEVLIDVLSEVRSVHPSSTLSQFVLGRNTLGSQDSGA